MDFCMRIASEVIINEINENHDKNFVMSPISLNCVLNMVASGAKGRTLEQLLEFLESVSIDDINAKSSRMIRLVTMQRKPNKKEEPILPHGSHQFDKSPASNRGTSSDQYWAQQLGSAFANPNWIDPFYESANRGFNRLVHHPIFYPSNLPRMEHQQFPEFPFSNLPRMDQEQHLRGTWGMMHPAAQRTRELCSSYGNYETGMMPPALMRPSKRRNEESSRPRGPELSFVGGVWMDHKFPVQPSFGQIAKDVYKAEAKTVDFVFQGEQVREEVNKWAENETKGLIKDFIPPGFITKQTVLILANALYFKGEWLCPFESSRTRHEAFYLLNRKTVRVPFMKSNNGRRCYASFGGFKILKLPYASGQDDKLFSMYIFLPHKNDGLQELLQNFNSQSTFLQKNLPLQEVVLSKVWIPKFKLSYGFDASDILTKLGLTLPFEMLGDFTEMVDSPFSKLVFVSNILHKSFIEVNEEGTEAAAASCALMMCGSAAPQYPTPPLPSFVADHPFMFMIKEEVSGTVFFTETVLNPLNED